MDELASVNEIDIQPRELPAFVIDRYGGRIQTTDEVWYANDPSLDISDAAMDFTQIHAKSTREALKHWIVHSIKAHSPQETRNQFHQIRLVLQLNGEALHSLAELNLSWFQKTRQILREKNSEYRLHRVRAWYLWLSDQGFEDIDDDIATTIDSWVIPGNVKGEAVRKHDSDRGPLNYREFAHLMTYLRGLLAKGHRGQTLAAIFLCTDIGPNPKQLSLLEVRDLRVLVDPLNGNKSYMLDVPRIKKRLDGREVKRRVISEETGELLEDLISTAPEDVKKLGERAPIFWARAERSFPVGSEFKGRFDWHRPSAEFRILFWAFSKKHNLCAAGSERTYVITPRRLRYTFGTRLAAQGVAPAKIAELLDHTDLQHVGVYVQSTELLSDRLDEKIGDALNPYARRAFGFVDGPPGSLLGSSRTNIAHPTKPVGVGDCGSKSNCRFSPPFACYDCAYFQPWRDADHAGALAALEKQKELSGTNSLSSTDRMPHQLDIVIQRVREIVAAQADLHHGGT